MKRGEALIFLTILLFMSILCELLNAQPVTAELKLREILFETNNGYQDMTSTTKKVFVSYEQYWNGVKVQQCIIKPSLLGAPPFAAHQNRPLLIHTQIRREGGPISAATLRNHSYWQTDFEGTTFFGQGDEYAWGNIAVDLQ
jgi:hypothetical protein